ncbi:hypothetical protein L1F30_09800 [Simiduia sp. 21SJ11W-1]|uniref:hypothetical protein n=1 Tax=Simiduia sp. 21SJ11W-1 TaxID=2909669 RepID=UPI0020A1A755|nr:hypothetical protein [Simiduia sp. 21SJ11W-1]UTA46467.1 hypothetical protein L1F30_09800 [Simiduia sp. 21SJ11W-1]
MLANVDFNQGVRTMFGPKIRNNRFYVTFAALVLSGWLVGCEQQTAPDLADAQWQAFRVDFCTETSAHEYWETRDETKLALLQGAFYMDEVVATEKLVQSKNHRLYLVVNEDNTATTWALTLKRDQEHVSFFNTADPRQRFEARSDAMFYRALNTLLESHMNVGLDIFRKCELAGE